MTDFLPRYLAGYSFYVHVVLVGTGQKNQTIVIARARVAMQACMTDAGAALNYRGFA